MEGDSVIEITQQEFEDRKDYYCDKAESGTPILVEKPDGAKMLVVPTNPDDLNYDFLNEHNDGC
tara:strand:- start:47 stop:238 length:192 start_codon:yes stop_codon:yes gene_type:complete